MKNINIIGKLFFIFLITALFFNCRKKSSAPTTLFGQMSKMAGLREWHGSKYGRYRNADPYFETEDLMMNITVVDSSLSLVERDHYFSVFIYQGSNYPYLTFKEQAGGNGYTLIYNWVQDTMSYEFEYSYPPAALYNIEKLFATKKSSGNTSVSSYSSPMSGIWHLHGTYHRHTYLTGDTTLIDTNTLKIIMLSDSLLLTNEDIYDEFPTGYPKYYVYRRVNSDPSIQAFEEQKSYDQSNQYGYPYVKFKRIIYSTASNNMFIEYLDINNNDTTDEKLYAP